MAGAFDFKKEYKDLYSPKAKPGVIDIPKMVFIMVDGRGNPNTSAEYKEALELLYGLSYAIKMSKMSGAKPEGYYGYVVPPLEGLWWGKDGYFDGVNITDKNKLCWTVMIRQPEFVTQAVFEAAKTELAKKKPGLDLSKARLMEFAEGLCAQAAAMDRFSSIISLRQENQGFVGTERGKLTYGLTYLFGKGSK